MTLHSCVERALEANDSLAQERAGLEEIRGQVTQTRAEGLPRLDLKGSWSRARDPSFALDESFGGDLGPVLEPIYDALAIPVEEGQFGLVPDPSLIPAQTFYRAYLETRWEVQPTRLLRLLRAVRTALAQQEMVVKDLEHRTVEDVLAAYHRIVLAQENAQALNAELNARAEFLAVARRRFRLDLAAPLDTLQAAVSLANLRPQLRRAHSDVRAAGRDLNVLLGRDADAPLSVEVQFPIEDESISLEAALRLAQQRPDLERERLETALLRIQRGVQKAQNHPFFTVEGSYGYVAREVGNLGNEGLDTWRLAVTLTLPLFDGRLAHGQIKETEAALRRNEFGQREQERIAQAEVMAAVDALVVARENLSAAGLNMEMAEVAFRQMTRRYELGKADQLDVLNAQAQRFSARGNLIQARFDVLVGTATLKRAMGVSPASTLAQSIAQATAGGSADD